MKTERGCITHQWGQHLWACITRSTYGDKLKYQNQTPNRLNLNDKAMVYDAKKLIEKRD